MNYDIALLEKLGEDGLNFHEITLLYGFLTSPFKNGKEEVLPIEIMAKKHESSAMGFITPVAYEKLEWDGEGSGLNDFVSSILDDMELEEELSVDSYKDGNGNIFRVYEFNGLRIWLNRLCL